MKHSKVDAASGVSTLAAGGTDLTGASNRYDVPNQEQLRGLQERLRQMERRPETKPIAAAIDELLSRGKVHVRGQRGYALELGNRRLRPENVTFPEDYVILALQEIRVNGEVHLRLRDDGTGLEFRSPASPMWVSFTEVEVPFTWRMRRIGG